MTTRERSYPHPSFITPLSPQFYPNPSIHLNPNSCRHHPISTLLPQPSYPPLSSHPSMPTSLSPRIPSIPALPHPTPPPHCPHPSIVTPCLSTKCLSPATRWPKIKGHRLWVTTSVSSQVFILQHSASCLQTYPILLTPSDTLTPLTPPPPLPYGGNLRQTTRQNITKGGARLSDKLWIICGGIRDDSSHTQGQFLCLSVLRCVKVPHLTHADALARTLNVPRRLTRTIILLSGEKAISMWPELCFSNLPQPGAEAWICLRIDSAQVHCILLARQSVCTVT